MAEQQICESGKAEQIPANRLLGVYPQKQDGLFMQRIRIPGGRISWPQWRKITELAIKYTPGVPLHLTTRQDIELHDVTHQSIPAVHEGLAEAALTIFGAGGDSVRNVTVCAGCDLCRDAFDLLPMARFVQSYLEQQPVIFNLGRKFKISFSGCEQACARPWVSDLGFIAKANGLFTVMARSGQSRLWASVFMKNCQPGIFCRSASQRWNSSNNRASGKTEAGHDFVTLEKSLATRLFLPNSTIDSSMSKPGNHGPISCRRQLRDI